MNSWDKMFTLWLMSRNGGKSTLIAPFTMTKMLLFPNFESYILSITAAQSQDTFSKMEKIAKKQIESFTGLTDFYLGEVVTGSNTDGFTHSPAGFKFQLYNGSRNTSLSGMEDNIRGKRSNLNVYDESGWLDENYIVTTAAFTAQNATFKLGKDVDNTTIPKNIPNQLVFCSSASGMDTYFYQLYKDYSKMMLLGSKDHFVADIDCDCILHATNHGVVLPVPLLTQDKIDDALRQNREKARREYYNEFSAEGAENQPIKRAVIMKNSVLRVPMLCNESNEKRRIVMAYDPARSYDGSVITIGELVEDENVGTKLRIVNSVSLVDIGKKNKTPMRTPEQVEYLKKLMLDYNGEGYADYENIERILIDAGAGGAGVNIGDYLMHDWVGQDGKNHKGIIDPVYSADYVRDFPNAMDILTLVSPVKYRNEMFDSFIEMLNLGLIEFTEDYDMKGYLMLPTEKNGEITYKRRNLSFEEELALKNIDFGKEQGILMSRYESVGTGNYRYDLPPDKRRTMHDDHFFTLALLGWHLKNVRHKDKMTVKKEKNDLNKLLLFKNPKMGNRRNGLF